MTCYNSIFGPVQQSPFKHHLQQAEIVNGFRAIHSFRDAYPFGPQLSHKDGRFYATLFTTDKTVRA